jgi:hypothetical protein
VSARFLLQDIDLFMAIIWRKKAATTNNRVQREP